jgi:hypothetical protein
METDGQSVPKAPQISRNKERLIPATLFLVIARGFISPVTRLLASDGSFLDSFRSSISATAITAEGTSLWVTNDAANGHVTRLGNDGIGRQHYAVGSYPHDILFAANAIWVSTESNAVCKISPTQQ